MSDDDYIIPSLGVGLVAIQDQCLAIVGNPPSLNMLCILPSLEEAFPFRRIVLRNLRLLQNVFLFTAGQLQ